MTLKELTTYLNQLPYAVEIEVSPAFHLEDLKELDKPDTTLLLDISVTSVSVITPQRVVVYGRPSPCK